MWCYSSDQMADEDYWYPCLLMPLSTGFCKPHRTEAVFTTYRTIPLALRMLLAGTFPTVSLSRVCCV